MQHLSWDFLGDQQRRTGDPLMLGRLECRGVTHSIFSCPDNTNSGFPRTDPFLRGVYAKIISQIILTLQSLVLWCTFGISIKSNHQMIPMGISNRTIDFLPDMSSFHPRRPRVIKGHHHALNCSTQEPRNRPNVSPLDSNSHATYQNILGLPWWSSG